MLRAWVPSHEIYLMKLSCSCTIILLENRISSYLSTINCKTSVLFCRRGSLYHFEIVVHYLLFESHFYDALFFIPLFYFVYYLIILSNLFFNFLPLTWISVVHTKNIAQIMFSSFCTFSNRILTQWIKTLQMERPEEKNDITMIAWSGKTAGHGCFILQTLPYSVRMRTIEK